MTLRDTEAPKPPELPADDTADSTAARRRWILPAVGAALVIMIGAGVGYAVSSGSDGAPDSQHFVTVMLEPGVTAAQQAAVEAELKDWRPVVGPQVKSADDAASAAAEIFQDDPEALERAGDMTLPAMIFLTVESPAFDCGPVPALRKLSGVQDVMIDGVAKPGARFGRINCAP